MRWRHFATSPPSACGFIGLCAALPQSDSYLENQRMFLDRNGYLEETFFTFSFSPIRDETGVAGLFHPVTETTARMLSERRTRALRDLAARAGKAQTMEEACTLAAQTLSEYQLDLPFVLFYLFDARGKEARLIASTALPQGSVASPAVVDLGVRRLGPWRRWHARGRNMLTTWKRDLAISRAANIQ